MGKLGKDEAKRMLFPLGIPMAKTYGILRTRADVAAMRPWMATHDRFVLKPASGHGGEGILLVRGKAGPAYDTSMGPLTEAQVEVQGLASLAGECGGRPPGPGAPHD